MPLIPYDEMRSYRELIENAGDVIASFSWDGIILDVNRQAELLLGWSREELIGQHVSKVATPDAVALAEERARRFLAGEQLPPVFEAELICKDERRVPVEARTWVFRDERGQLAGFHGIYRDLTVRRQAEAALRESEERYRLLFDKANDGLTVLHITPEGTPSRFSDVNEVMCQRLGYTRQELLQMAPADLLAQECVGHISRLVEELLRSGHVLFEAVHLAKDGCRIPVEVNAHLFELHGERTVLAIARDMTERKRAEAALRKSEEALQRERELFIGGPVMTFKWKTTPGWPIEYVSPNVMQLGYGPEDLLNGGFSYAELIHPEDLTQVVNEVQASLASGKEAFEREYRLRRTDGQFRWVYDFTRILRNKSGEATHLDGYILDISERRQAEGALQLNEAHYRALVEGSIQGICVLSRDDRILFANPALAAIFGYDHPEEMLGVDVLRLIAPQDHDRMNRYSAARLRGDTAPIRYEFTGLKRGDTPIWLEVLVSVVPWDGEPTILATLIDITARKKVEQELQHSEEQYRTLVEQIHDGVFVIQDGVIRFANDACAQSVGYSVQELIGRELDELIAPEDREFVLDRYRRRQAGETVPSQYEVRLLHGDSVSRVFVEVRATLTRYQGRIATLGTLRDITARKRAEEQLREEAEINAALARVAQEMIASLDTSVIMEHLCRVATDVLDCDCSHAYLWFPEEKAYRVVAGYGDTLEQWEMVRFLKVPREALGEETLQRLQEEEVLETLSIDAARPFPEGVMRQLGITETLSVALRRGSLAIGFLNASYRGRRGFSERQKRLAHGLAQIASLALANARLLEEIERSNRVKEDFVSTMSHELRTPLNIILGYNQLLREEAFGPLADKQANIIERVQKTAQELLELINATLDLSRLQSRRVPLEIQEVHVPEFMRALEADGRQLNRNPNLELQWSTAPALPVLRTDAVKVKMVLKNLLTNALKFTEAGTVSVRVEAQADGVMFSIADTGPGIAPEDLAVIFEPFRQGGEFATRHQGGVGLGLYIVRQLLELLGGKISVTSEVGKGSTFRVWLPEEGARPANS